MLHLHHERHVTAPRQSDAARFHDGVIGRPVRPVTVRMEDGRRRELCLLRHVQKADGVHPRERLEGDPRDRAILTLDLVAIGEVQGNSRRQRIEAEACHRLPAQQSLAALPVLQRLGLDRLLLRHPGPVRLEHVHALLFGEHPDIRDGGAGRGDHRRQTQNGRDQPATAQAPFHPSSRRHLRLCHPSLLTRHTARTR